MRRTPVLLALGATLAAAACESAPTEPEVSAPDAQALAPQIAGIGAGVVDGLALGMQVFAAGAGDPRESTTEFTRTATCPKGGQITIQGTAQTSVDRESRSMSSQFDVTQTAQDCAFDARGTQVVINGNPNVKITATRRIEEGRLVAARTTQKGSVVYQRGDQRRTCDMDLTSTVDPAARTVTIAGIMCGREVSLTHEWREPRRPNG